MTNAIGADHLSLDERLAELAAILALGLVRLQARQSSHLSRKAGESLLDCPAHQSRHADAKSAGGLWR